MSVIAGLVGRPQGDFACRWRDEIRTALGGFASSSWSTCDSGGALLCSGLSSSRPGSAWIVQDDRIAIAADLRIDNAHDLARRLDMDRGAGTSPGTLMLACWSRWGVDCLDYLVGDFAIAVFDRRERTTWLARDPTGQRPMFFAQRANLLGFGSMPSALQPLLGSLVPDPKLVAEIVANRINWTDATYFRDVRRVLPGQVVRISRDTVTSAFHWHPDARGRSTASKSQLIDEYRSLLDLAVGARLGDEGPLGAHLSSGFDSNAVSATAARLVDGRRKLVAFTSAPSMANLENLPRGRFADESTVAGRSAAAYGMEHVVIRTASRPLDVWSRVAAQQQAPVMNVFNMDWWSQIRRSAAERNITTVLNGQIGNVSLHAGGLSILAEWMRLGAYRTWWSQARSAAARADVRWRGVMIHSVGGYLPNWGLDAVRRVSLRPPSAAAGMFLSRAWRERLSAEQSTLLRPSRDVYADRLRMIAGMDPGQIRKAALLDGGVEEPDPMSDRRLIEFSLRLPPEHLLWNGEYRPLARRALSDRVPAEILDQQQRGLQSSDWFCRLSQAQAREALDMFVANPGAGDLLDIPKMKRAIDAWPNENWNSLAVRMTYKFALTNAIAAGVFMASFT